MMAELRLGKIKFCVGLFAIFAMCYTSLFVFTMSLRLFTIRLVDYSATANMLYRNANSFDNDHLIGWTDKRGNQSESINTLENSRVDMFAYVNISDLETLFKGGEDRVTQQEDNLQYYFNSKQTNKSTFYQNGSGNFKYIYLFGAVVCNSSASSVWDELRLYGQWLDTFEEKYSNTAACCVRYGDGFINRIATKNRIKNFVSTSIPAFYFVFDLPRRTNLSLPTEAALVTDDATCLDKDIPYIKTLFPRKESGRLGITSKIAYGSLSSETIIEWVEAMKHLGVDKIITYADGSLNEAALKTLQYYERTGLVEVFPYNQPAKDISPRDPSEKRIQKFSDARVLIYDAFERLRGYTYFAIIDMDEFLIPSKGRSLKQLMGDLLAQNSKTRIKVTGFFFKTVYFIKSWGIVNVTCDLDIGKYLNRTTSEPAFDRRKAIVIRDNVLLYIHTHTVESKAGYKMLNCPANESYIRHYRNCRSDWMVNNHCMGKMRRKTTYEMITWANENIANRVREVRKQLFG